MPKTPTAETMSSSRPDFNLDDNIRDLRIWSDNCQGHGNPTEEDLERLDQTCWDYLRSRGLTV